ncbi:gluconokinase [Cellulomonas fimi]|uniref:Gluconokinase n=1 Tax=Cellulomonas fimi TaxID=1708 RepID=A0A7Y0QJF0_CELFI|nr:gluconokinase [Cellulomonas fimi]NMR21272.1 gluconokinase [Cellulomonas fimi]
MSGAVRPPQEVVLGLDVGTTAAKAVAFGVGSFWRHGESVEYPLLEPSPGWQVQDPDQLVGAAHEALARCVAACRGAQVVAVSLSTAMHGLIGLDAGLRPLTPLLTWADARATEQARALRESGQATGLHQRTGTPVHSMTPLTKLMWLAEHEPALCADVRWWVDLKAYLVASLTGQLVTELSSASASGLMDTATRTWSPPAVALTGASIDQLPPILPTTTALDLTRAVAERTGLPLATPVVVGAADGPLGNLGVDALEPGVVGLSLGTSGAVRMMVRQPPAHLDESLFCYALTEDAWAVGGAVSNGGIVVRWVGSALAPDLTGVPGGPTADEQVLELAAAVPPGSDGLLMVPYLLAERAPLWDPTLTGAYLGLRREHTRGHLVRAAVEGVSLQLATIVDRIDRVEPVASVRATGGALRSALWRQVLAATLDRPLHSVGAAEGSALGAAALGLYALGRAPSLGAAVDLLAAPGRGAAELVEVDTSMVDVYARSRAALPLVVDSLERVAALLRTGSGAVGAGAAAAVLPADLSSRRG